MRGTKYFRIAEDWIIAGQWFNGKCSNMKVVIIVVVVIVVVAAAIISVVRN